MKYIASSGTDKARFYISKAPRTSFSTAVLNVSNFNVQMFFDIFERHMQSNAQEVIDDGWSSTISPRAGGAKRRARVLIPPGYLHPGKRKH
jgi:hypothetical protein